MESSAFPEAPILDNKSDEKVESPETEDVAEGPDSQDIPGPSESAATQDPVQNGGKKRSKKRATLHCKRIETRSNQPRAVESKPPTSSLSLMIYTAVANSQKKSGLSLQAIKKIAANMGYDVAKKKHYVLRSIRNMVAKGQLWQIKGTGATGSFKINPNIGNNKLMKGKGPKIKRSTKNKKKSAMSKNGRETAKKQVKADVKKPLKRGRMSSVQASSIHV